MKMSIIRLSAIAVMAVFLWLAFVIVAAFKGLWMDPVATEGDVDGFYDYAVSSLQENNRGNSALVLIEAGKPKRQFHASAANSVDADTVFAAASMSKWIAAVAMMKLVEDGQADLDLPVSRYLSRWRLPETGFGNEGVTIRRLLSHTAGLGDELGFGDYGLDETLPSLEQSLARPRASSGAAAAIAVTVEPGSEWRYSGGGYLLLELLIEEISGMSFERYVEEKIFTQLGMVDAGYDHIDSYANSAGSYLPDGSRATAYKYASRAATGLVVSSADLTRFVVSQISPAETRGPLSMASIQAMREPHGRTSGADIWGLGTILYAPTASGDFVFGHDGANDPAINTAARINPETGDAIILLVTGQPALASRIGAEWVLWQTGYPDVLAVEAVFASMLVPAISGCALILIAAAALGIRTTASR